MLPFTLINIVVLVLRVGNDLGMLYVFQPTV